MAIRFISLALLLLASPFASAQEPQASMIEVLEDENLPIAGETETGLPVEGYPVAIVRGEDGSVEVVPVKSAIELFQLRVVLGGNRIQRFSVALGVVLRDDNCEFRCSAVLLEVAPGIAGGKASAGWLGLEGWGLVSSALKASVLRTWGNARSDFRNKTYVGVEYEANILVFQASVGVFHRVTGGNDGSRRWVFALGGGIDIGWFFP